MSRCPSCNVPLSGWELSRKSIIELPDGEVFLIDEEFCNSCLSTYVTHADDLITSNHQFEDITDDFSILMSKACD